MKKICGYLIIFTCFICSLLLLPLRVSAKEDYEFKVLEITDNEYGNTLNYENIKYEASIKGSVFMEEISLSNLENKNIKITFTPEDGTNYDPKEIDYLLNVNKRKIEIIFADKIYKQYDGTTYIKLPNYSFSKILNNEVLVEGNLKGELFAPGVSENAGIKLSGLNIVGERKDYYVIDYSNHYANIYPKFLEQLFDESVKIEVSEKDIVELGYVMESYVNDINKQYNSKHVLLKEIKVNVKDKDDKDILFKENIKLHIRFEKELMDSNRTIYWIKNNDGDIREANGVVLEDRIIIEMSENDTLMILTREYETILIAFFFSLILIVSLSEVIVCLVKRKKSLIKI